MQANEALKILVGYGEPLTGRLLMFDAMQTSFRTLKLRRDPECATCGAHAEAWQAWESGRSAVPREAVAVRMHELPAAPAPAAPEAPAEPVSANGAAVSAAEAHGALATGAGAHGAGPTGATGAQGNGAQGNGAQGNGAQGNGAKGKHGKGKDKAKHKEAKPPASSFA